MAMVQRPDDIKVGEPAGDARAMIVADRSANEAEQVLENEVEPETSLMSDEAKAFIGVHPVRGGHLLHSKRIA